MRKSKRSGAATPSPTATLRNGAEVSLPDLHTRSGRVGGAQVAFGAPGPRIDLDRVLETWRQGATTEGMTAGDGTAWGPTVGGAAAGATNPADAATQTPPGDGTGSRPGHTRAGAPRTVSLPDGTTISFTVAGAALALDP